MNDQQNKSTEPDKDPNPLRTSIISRYPGAEMLMHTCPTQSQRTLAKYLGITDESTPTAA